MKRSANKEVKHYCNKMKKNSIKTISQLDDYSILEIVDRMDWRTRKAFALTCKRFYYLLPSGIGRLVAWRYVNPVFLNKNFTINGSEVKLETDNYSNYYEFHINHYKYMLSVNLTELTLDGLRLANESCEYDVSFDRLKCLKLINCRFNNFNYFWSACASTIEKLTYFGTIINEEYDYKFANLKELICEYPMSIVRFVDENPKSTFTAFIKRNPSIRKVQTSNQFLDYRMVKTIHNSNITDFHVKFCNRVHNLMVHKLVKLNAWKLQTFTFSKIYNNREMQVVFLSIFLALGNVKKIILRNFSGYDLVAKMFEEIFNRTDFQFVQTYPIEFDPPRYLMSSTEILHEVQFLVSKCIEFKANQPFEVLRTYLKKMYRI